MCHTLGLLAPSWMIASFARLFTNISQVRMLARLPVNEWCLLLFGVPFCWNMRTFLIASPVARTCTTSGMVSGLPHRILTLIVMIAIWP